MNGIVYADSHVICEHEVHDHIVYKNYVDVFNYYNTTFKELLTYYGYKIYCSSFISSGVITCKLVDINDFFHGEIIISFSKDYDVENEIIFIVHTHSNMPYSFKYYFIDDKSFKESIYKIDSFVCSNKLRQSMYIHDQHYFNNYPINNEYQDHINNNSFEDNINNDSFENQNNNRKGYNSRRNKNRNRRNKINQNNDQNNECRDTTQGNFISNKYLENPNKLKLNNTDWWPELNAK